MRHIGKTVAVVLLPFANGGWTYCGSWDGDKVLNVCMPETGAVCDSGWSDRFIEVEGRWNGVIADPQFSYDPTPNAFFGAGNGIDEAEFSTHATMESVYGPLSASVIGVTWTTKSGCGPQIETDVFLLVDFSWTLTRESARPGGPYFFDEVAAHELGHVATLDHEDGILSLMNTFVHGTPAIYGYPHIDEVDAMMAHTAFDAASREDLAVLPYASGSGVATVAPWFDGEGQTVLPGDLVSVDDFHVENWGTKGDRAFDLTFVLSTDAVGGQSDVRAETVTWSSLGFGITSGPVAIRIPDVAPGWYHLIGVADIDGALADAQGFNDQLDFGSFEVGCDDDDGDGYEAERCGGDDCDDGDWAIHPNQSDDCDGADEDCDGAVDEDCDEGLFGGGGEEGGSRSLVSGCGCAAGPGGLPLGWVAAALSMWALARRIGAAPVAAAAVFVALLGAPAASQACTVPLSERDLVGLSEQVVVGRVVEVSAEPWGAHGATATRVRVEIDEVWKGADSAVVEVWQAGGPIVGGGAVTAPAGAVPYAVGTQMVLFLERSPSGVLVTAGLDLGALVVAEGTLTVPRSLGTTRTGTASNRPFVGSALGAARAVVVANLDAPWPVAVPRHAPAPTGTPALAPAAVPIER